MCGICFLVDTTVASLGRIDKMWFFCYFHAICDWLMRIIRTVKISEFGACPRKPCNNGYYPIHEAAKNASSKTMEVFFQVFLSVDVAIVPTNFIVDFIGSIVRPWQRMYMNKRTYCGINYAELYIFLRRTWQWVASVAIEYAHYIE